MPWSIISNVCSPIKKFCHVVSNVCTPITRKICSPVQKLWNALPGIAKVTASTGGTVFNVVKFFEYVTKTKDGLTNYYCIGLSSFAAVASLSTNIVTRFFNLYRKETTKKKEDKAENLGCGFEYFRIVAIAYTTLSSAASYLNLHSLLRLFQAIFNFEYKEECTESNISWGKIAVVYLATLYLIYSSSLSFKKYNFASIRDYYKRFFNNGEWRNIKCSTYLFSVIGTLINTMGVFFGNKNFFKIFQKNTLCHMTDASIPNEVVNAVGGLSCFTNFNIAGFSQLAANNNAKTDIAQHRQYLSELPGFQKADCWINFSIFIYALSDACGALVSFTTFPENFTSDTHLNYNPFIIALATIAGVFGFFNQKHAYWEGYNRELLARSSSQKEILAKLGSVVSDTTNQNNLHDPLLTANTESLATSSSNTPIHSPVSQHSDDSFNSQQSLTPRSEVDSPQNSVDEEFEDVEKNLSEVRPPQFSRNSSGIFL